MTLTFTTSLGELAMGKGYDWRIKAVDGLGFLERESQTATFPDVAGQTTLSTRHLARTITVALDLLGAEQEKSCVLRLLEAPGTLLVDTGLRKRKICARAVAFDENERYGGGIASFTLQLLCDNPYFHDVQDTVFPALGVNGLLGTYFTEEEAQALGVPYGQVAGTGEYSTFLLPALFSSLSNDGVIQNAGDVRAEPVIHIACLGDNSISALALNNLTTGQHITLDTGISEGETIVIDIPNRSVTSNLRSETALLKTLSSDTYLSQFWLAPGENRLKTTPTGAGADQIFVSLIYNNNYVEAVY